MEFNISQKKIINTLDGPLIAISCAGSGKTSVILERTYQLLIHGVKPSEILVSTFSRAAAKELADRFSRKYQISDVNFSTIHSVCFAILRKAYGLGAKAVLSNSDKRMFFREQYASCGKALKEEFGTFDAFYEEMSLRISRSIYSRYMNPVKTVANDQAGEAGDDIYHAYIKFKNQMGKIDYDDMIIGAHRCLKEQSDTLAYWQKSAKYIMIDEFQDTSAVQAEIFYMLSGNRRNICVVGDDDQSIYGFRGSEPGIFNKFREVYPDTKMVVMDTNYRSLPIIIESAQSVISNNSNRIPKSFHAYRNEEGRLDVISVKDNLRQTNEVVRILREYEKRQIPWKDIAVLFRLKRSAQCVYSRMLTEKIPVFTNEMPDDIYDGMVFGDIRSYFRLANGCGSVVDLKRIIDRPNRYIRKELLKHSTVEKDYVIASVIPHISNDDQREKVFASIEKLYSDLGKLKNQAPRDFVRYLGDEMGYRSSLREYASFVNENGSRFCDEYDELLWEADHFESFTEWFSNIEEGKRKKESKIKEKKENGVCFTTFHGAKGLEWKHCIIISANEEITPYSHMGEIENPEEERRLFYVAMTRAKDELTIIHLKAEKNGGNPAALRSRYIDEFSVKKQERHSILVNFARECSRFRQCIS